MSIDLQSLHQKIEAIMQAEKESNLTPALPDKIPDR
jgi:hypothetical protein